MSNSPSLGIVIPALNCAEQVARLLPNLTSGLLDIDIVAADGGSSDATVETAGRHGGRIASAEGGRGPQLREGCATALGDWLLLLHVDSELPAGWDRTILDFISDAANSRRAGYFRFLLDHDAPEARRLERMVAWRCRTFGLPYGDQGLLISRSFLEELGGVPDLPLMEDVALARRIGKERLVELDTPLRTSAEKFRRDGYLIRSSKNLFCLTLYFLGVPPNAIRRLY